MGKGTDKLYITHSEWSSGDQFSASSGTKNAGKGLNQRTDFKRLPFNFCALSLQPFSHPVCTKDGTVFDLTHIVPWLRKNATNPVNGNPLARAELIKLNFMRNEDLEYCDPVTYKPFTDNTHIIALENTGNVFAWETIDRLNIQPKNWRDLISDEQFARNNIITLQDPQHPEARNYTTFKYFQNSNVSHSQAELDGERSMSGFGTDSKAPNKLLKAHEAVARARAQQANKGATSKPIQDNKIKSRRSSKSTCTPDPAQASGAASGSAMKNVAGHTSGKAAASFTSTGLTPHTSNERVNLSEEEYILKPRLVKEKGYARVQTTHGDIIVELETEFAPRAVWNFVRLAKQGYYKNVPFHRSIRNFMLQGGDPTGTGRGGKSIWGHPFVDEWPQSPLKHDSRGTVSMANKGRDTNTSQFFITYRPSNHLDRKHTIFGRVIESNQSQESETTLRRLEALDTDASDKPIETCKIKDVIVFVDPFEEFTKASTAKQAEAEEYGARKENATDNEVTWTGKRVHPGTEAHAISGKNSVVGKYVEDFRKAPLMSGTSERPDGQRRLQSRDLEMPFSKKRKGAGFGNFDGW